MDSQNPYLINYWLIDSACCDCCFISIKLTTLAELSEKSENYIFNNGSVFYLVLILSTRMSARWINFYARKY